MTVDSTVRSTGRTLVLGGIRSGKSAYAERVVETAGRAVTYVATAPPRPDDPEWADRIAAHRSRRPAGWRTVEPAHQALPTLLADTGPADVVLVDDIGAWLVDVLDGAGAWAAPGTGPGAAVSAAVGALVAAVAACPARLVLVSPEVGLSVVPATVAGRVFADALGSANQALAAAVDSVVLVVAGIPCTLTANGAGGTFGSLPG